MNFLKFSIWFSVMKPTHLLIVYKNRIIFFFFALTIFFLQKSNFAYSKIDIFFLPNKISDCLYGLHTTLFDPVYVYL